MKALAFTEKYVAPFFILAMLLAFVFGIGKTVYSLLPHNKAGDCVKIVLLEGDEFTPPIYEYVKIIHVGKSVYKTAELVEGSENIRHTTRSFFSLNISSPVFEPKCSDGGVQ